MLDLVLILHFNLGIRLYAQPRVKQKDNLIIKIFNGIFRVMASIAPIIIFGSAAERASVLLI